MFLSCSWLSPSSLSWPGRCTRPTTWVLLTSLATCCWNLLDLLQAGCSWRLCCPASGVRSLHITSLSFLLAPSASLSQTPTHVGHGPFHGSAGPQRLFSMTIFNWRTDFIIKLLRALLALWTSLTCSGSSSSIKSCKFCFSRHLLRNILYFLKLIQVESCAVTA